MDPELAVLPEQRRGLISGSGSMEVDEVWRSHRRWAVVADGLSASLRRWRAINLALILAGSTLAALAAQGWIARGARPGLGAASAAVLATAGIVQSRLLSADRTANRVAARAAAEAYKAIVYRFLAAAGADPNRGQELGSAVVEIEKLTTDNAVLVAGVRPDGEALPGIGGIVDYRDERAIGQRDWHDQRAARHERLAHRWRAAELLATTAAAIIAAVGGVIHGPSLSAWVAVATTASAAFAAHLAGEQHDRIAQSYMRTVVGLDSLLRDFDAASAPADEAARFVAGVETVLAHQNESWTSLFKR